MREILFSSINFFEIFLSTFLWGLLSFYLTILILPFHLKLQSFNFSYSYYKVTSFYMTSFTIWIFAFLFNIDLNWPYFLSLFLFSSVGLLYQIRLNTSLYKNYFLKNKVEIFLTEVLFIVLTLCSLFFYLYFQFPAVGEKVMDLQNLNFFYRESSPWPSDPWLKSSPFHYYFLGPQIFSRINDLFSVKQSLIYLLTLSLNFSFLILSFISISTKKSKLSLKVTTSLFFLVFSPIASFFYFTPKPSVLNFWNVSRSFNSSYFTEFPLWSFLFGDLHPHLFSYPIVIILLVSLFSIFNKDKVNFYLIGSTSIILGSLLGVNGWSFVFILPLVILLFIIKKNINYLLIFFTSMIFSLPWIYILRSGKELLIGSHQELPSFFGFALQYSHIVFFLLLSLILLGFKKKKQLVFLGYFLIVLLALSFFYLNDSINTIFKFGNMLHLLGTFIIGTMILEFNNRSKLIIFLSSFFLYSILSFGTLFHQVKKFALLPKLEPISISSDKGKVIDWIYYNVDGAPILIEKGGDAFDRSLDINALTGLPTLAGWRNHLYVRHGVNSFRLINTQRRVIDSFYATFDTSDLENSGVSFYIIYAPFRYSSQEVDQNTLLFETPSIKLFGLGKYQDFLTR